MLNNYFRRLFFKIKSGTTNIRFSVPFISVMEPVNDLVDLLNFIGLLIPYRKDDLSHVKQYSLHKVLKIIKLVEMVFWELRGMEPFDLVDIDTKDTTVHIGFR